MCEFLFEIIKEIRFTFQTYICLGWFFIQTNFHLTVIFIVMKRTDILWRKCTANFNNVLNFTIYISVYTKNEFLLMIWRSLEWNIKYFWEILHIQENYTRNIKFTTMNIVSVGTQSKKTYYFLLKLFYYIPQINE